MPLWTIALFIGVPFVVAFVISFLIGWRKKKKQQKENLEKMVRLEDENDGRLE